MDQLNAPLAGFLQSPEVRAGQNSQKISPISKMSKFEVAVSSQPWRVGTWDLHRWIQDEKLGRTCTHVIWPNFTPRQSYETSKLLKSRVFEEIFKNYTLFSNLDIS